MAQDDKTLRRWMDVYNGLASDIISGDLTRGSDLPTLAELARREDLTSHGARRVMERLTERGLVQSWQGKGYRVALPRLRMKMGERSPVFGDRVRAQGFDCTSELISAHASGAPRAIAKRMRRKPGTKVLATQTLRKVSGHPCALSIDYFLRDRLDGIDESLRETGSVSRSLAAHGVETYERDHTSLEARMPTAHEVVVLDIPKTQPVYETVGANLDQNGVAVQVSKAVWRADCVTYEC